MSLWRRVYTERRSVMLPVIALLVINAAVLLLGVLPLKRSVVTSEQAAIDARIDLGNARRFDMQAKAERDGKDRAVAELQKFYAEILPKGYGRAVEVTNYWLDQVARQYGVVFRTGAWQQEDVRDSRLTNFKGKVTLTGDYADIRKFLYHVETAEQFVIIEEVALAQANTAQANSVIEVSLSVSTYYLTAPGLEAPIK
jgi:Tfp pilus assembly protein PilO